MEKKLSESRKKLLNPEKYIRVKKKKKKKKKKWDREKKINIEKNISESRKMFENGELFCYKSREKILNSINSNSTNLPANICLFKVNNKNTRKRCEICSKLIIKTEEWRQWHHSDIIIVNFEHIPHFPIMFLLLTSNK